MSNGAYVIISPVRNEAEYLRKTIDSVAAQTIRPARWVIVNDGSTDNTRELIEEAAREHPWIQPLHRGDRGFRSAGGGVMEAFYDGFRFLDGVPWEFLVKLDGDLSFEPSYFEACLKHFQDDTKLGIGGGTICGEVGGVLMPEAKGDPPFHVRGATKIYRRQCWDGLGQLVKAPGWDTMDEVKANMLGWNTYSFPELKLNHHRYSGNADGQWKNWVKNGRANYVCGYHPLFMMFKCVSRLGEKPRIVAAAGLFYGFLGAWLKNTARVDDPALIRYFRNQQIRRLTLRDNLWTRTSLK